VGKVRAHRNRTITLTQAEREHYSKKLIRIHKPAGIDSIENKILSQDILEILDFLPAEFVDLLILDPPYNINKTFKSSSFKKKDINEYAQWFEDNGLKTCWSGYYRRLRERPQSMCALNGTLQLQFI
jgi:site-specific DNA-methyltransferase (adenine-specific)